MGSLLLKYYGIWCHVSFVLIWILQGNKYIHHCWFSIAYLSQLYNMIYILYKQLTIDHCLRYLYWYCKGGRVCVLYWPPPTAYRLFHSLGIWHIIWGTNHHWYAIPHMGCLCAIFMDQSVDMIDFVTNQMLEDFVNWLFHTVTFATFWPIRSEIFINQILLCGMYCYNLNLVGKKVHSPLLVFHLLSLTVI